MSHKGISIEMANDRARWTALTDDWLQHHGLNTKRAHMNIFLASADSYLWHRCCCRVRFTGSKWFLGELLRGTFELDRVLGWRIYPTTWVTGWIRPTFHLRMFIDSTTEDPARSLS